MPIDEQHIRNLAYQIWESEGRPNGERERHWEMARKLAEAEAEAVAPPSTPPAKPGGKTTGTGRKKSQP